MKKPEKPKQQFTTDQLKQLSGAQLATVVGGVSATRQKEILT